MNIVTIESYVIAEALGNSHDKVIKDIKWITKNVKPTTTWRDFERLPYSAHVFDQESSNYWYKCTMKGALMLIDKEKAEYVSKIIDMFSEFDEKIIPKTESEQLLAQPQNLDELLALLQGRPSGMSIEKCLEHAQEAGNEATHQQTEPGQDAMADAHQELPHRFRTYQEVLTQAVQNLLTDKELDLHSADFSAQYESSNLSFHFKSSTYTVNLVFKRENK